MDFAIVAAIALAVSGYMAGSVKIVNEGEAAVVERLGRYRRTMSSGLNFVVPFLDTVYVVSMREQLIDIDPQKAITKDRADVTLDAILFWRILDVYLARYAVESVDKALEQLVITSLRSEVGQLTLEELVSSRDKINRQMLTTLDKATQDWGVKVERVEIQDIKLSEELTRARESELAAESRKKAMLSEYQAAVESIKIISDALADSSNPKATLNYLIAKSYIEAQNNLSTSPNAKIVFMDPNKLTEATTEFITADGETPHSTTNGSSEP